MSGVVRPISKEALDFVLRHMATHYGIDRHQIFENDLRWKVAKARRSAFYVMTTAVGANQDSVAQISGRSRQAVAASVKTARHELERDPDYRTFIEGAIEATLEFCNQHERGT